MTKLLKNLPLLNKVKVGEGSIDKWGIDSLDKLINFKPNEKYKLELTLKSELDKKLFTKTKEELFLTYPFDDLGKITLTKILDYYHLENILKIDTELPKNYPDGIKEKTIQKLVEQINEFKIFLNLVTSSPSYNPIIKENNIQIDNKLLNKTFCITGTLSMSRKDIEKLIVDNGGIIKGVSRNLDYLIVGENPGTKLDKAKELGIFKIQ
jgi:DNA ligase (NAD+)